MHRAVVGPRERDILHLAVAVDILDIKKRRFGIEVGGAVLFFTRLRFNGRCYVRHDSVKVKLRIMYVCTADIFYADVKIHGVVFYLIANLDFYSDIAQTVDSDGIFCDEGRTYRLVEAVKHTGIISRKIIFALSIAAKHPA